MNNVITIPFHHQTITAIEQDNNQYVAMRPIVENLGLAWAAQFVKIKEKFGSCVSIIETTGSDGKQYEMTCLPVSKIAAFLYSINPNKVDPQYKDLIITYQEECDQVLHNFFFGHAQANPGAETLQLLRDVIDTQKQTMQIIQALVNKRKGNNTRIPHKDDIDLINSMRAEGIAQAEIARTLNLSTAMVSMIVRGLYRINADGSVSVINSKSAA